MAQAGEDDENGGGSATPTSDEIARRAQLRGLGKELMRMDIQNHVKQLKPLFRGQVRLPRPYSCSWTHSRVLAMFLSTADPVLHAVLTPYVEDTLLETHGEQFLELFISKAPDDVWKEWLFASLRVGAFADSVDVFLRLFALCESSGSELEPPHRFLPLLTTSAIHGCAGVLSALLAMDVFATAIRERQDAVKGGQQTISALVYAAMHGHRSCVAVLAKAGAPLEYKHYMGGTALMEAVIQGHKGTVLELLSAGADVNNVNDGAETKVCALHYANYSPLGMAVAENNVAMMDILLAAGADLGKDRTDTVLAPMIIAAQEGFCEPMERLLLAGADPNVVNSIGQSALHVACFYNHGGAVELLLRHHARLTPLCDEGLSPCDVIGMGSLEKQIRRRVGFEIGRRCYSSPTTLDEAETSAADGILGMLERASAWGRRGWLIMLRARRLVAAVQLPDAGTESSSPFADPPLTEQATHPHDGEAKEEPDLGVCVAVEALSLTDAPSTGTRSPGVFDGEEERSASLATALSEGDHGHEDAAGKRAEGGGGAGGVWRCAVEWVVRCPDERGVFREIMRFV